uniref:Uncharacterized protein n=1 Tax=Lotharella oceanica TaxID=641309 RepID=A0A7S2U0Y6_9EUKA
MTTELEVKGNIARKRFIFLVYGQFISHRRRLDLTLGDHRKRSSTVKSWEPRSLVRPVSAIVRALREAISRKLVWRLVLVCLYFAWHWLSSPVCEYCFGRLF